MSISSPPATPKPELSHLANSTGTSASMDKGVSTTLTTLTTPTGRKSPNRTFVAPTVVWPSYRPISPVDNDEADKGDAVADEEAHSQRPKRTLPTALRIPSPVFSLSPSVWRATLESSPHMRANDVPSLTRSSSMESVNIATPSYEALAFELNVLRGSKYRAPSPSPSPARMNEKRKVRSPASRAGIVRQVKSAPLPRGNMLEIPELIPMLPVSLHTRHRPQPQSPSSSLMRVHARTRGRPCTPFSFLPSSPCTPSLDPDDSLTPYSSRATHRDVNPSFPSLRAQTPRRGVAGSAWSAEGERRSRFREEVGEAEEDGLVGQRGKGGEKVCDGEGKKKAGWKEKLKEVKRGCRRVVFCSRRE
jgi:hypothetical protein